MTKVKYKINLTREKSSFDVLSLSSFWIPVILIFALLELCWAYFVFYMPFQDNISKARMEYQRLITRLHSLQRERIGDMKEVLDALVAERFNWAEKIAYLAKALPPEIYLREIKVEKEQDSKRYQKILVIKGIVESTSQKDPPEAVGNLIYALNSNPRFLYGLKSVELRGIQPLPRSNNKFLFELAAEYAK